MEKKKEKSYLISQLYDYLENTLEPHLSRGVLQTKNQDADGNEAISQISEDKAAKESRAEENVEILAGRNNKSEDNEYGQEELELFKEVMEGIYGEEI